MKINDIKIKDKGYCEELRKALKDRREPNSTYKSIFSIHNGNIVFNTHINKEYAYIRENEVILKYCPFCGRNLQRESKKDINLKSYSRYKKEDIIDGYLTEGETKETYIRYILRKIRDVIEDIYIYSNQSTVGDYWNLRNISNRLLSECLKQIISDDI